MAKRDRESVWLDGDEGDRLHAVWSRSGKRLIVTIWKRGYPTQIELPPAELDKLTRFVVKSTGVRSPRERA
jgi:hypothetical protein